jgi:hypothetical protein
MSETEFDGLGLRIARTEDDEPALAVSKTCHLCHAEDAVEMVHDEIKYDNDRYRFRCTACKRRGKWDVLVIQAYFAWRRLSNG